MAIILGVCFHESTAFAQSICDLRVRLAAGSQGTFCGDLFRPLNDDQSPAPFLMTARTQIDIDLPLDPDAFGSPGAASISANGAGVQPLSCDGSTGLSGSGEHANQELIFTFDKPTEAAGVTIGMDGIELGTQSRSNSLLENDTPVVFLSIAGTPDFEITIDEDQIIAATSPLVGRRVELLLGKVPGVLQGMLVDRIKVRATSGTFWVDLLGIGCALDCNHNGIADDIDLANCPPGHPSCDDCNLNGVPDECDIASGVTEDVDLNGVPDDCFEPLVSPANWSGDVWGLPGLFPYPDNIVGVPDLHVTLDADDLSLDVAAQIRTLRLLRGSVLSVTQASSGARVRSAAALALGDLSAVFPGGILDKGSIIVANDRRIAIPNGPLIIGEAGHYLAEPPSSKSGTTSTSAALSAQSITLLPTLCGETDQLTLSSFMTVSTVGDLTLNGIGARPCGVLSGSTASILGGHTPAVMRSLPTPDEVQRADTGKTDEPSVSGRPFVSLDIGGDFHILESGEVCVGCGREEGDTIPTMLLHGDFDNQSLYPSIFDWTDGGIELAGPGTQRFEVAGLDIGRSWEGYATDADALMDTSSHTNFSMRFLHVRQGAEVVFQNQYANTVTAGACGEALYVKKLSLDAGSTITLDNVHVYYDLLDDQGGTVQTLGCGELVPLCLANAPTMAQLTTNRYATFSGANFDRRSAVRVFLASLPAPFTSLNGTELWVGPPHDVSLLAGSVQPRVGAGTIKVAQLQCQPYFTNWGNFGEVHFYGAAVVPGSVLDVSEITEGCSASNATNYSAPMTTFTSVFGDVSGYYVDGVWLPPDGHVDFVSDVLSVVDAFTGRATAPSKTRADLEPALPDHRILITDVVIAINAFQGYGYSLGSTAPPCP